ncbi:UNVERIFIED_CONTAM: hypothetical protein FKN15_047541 [Acipenser sinensis]
MRCGHLPYSPGCLAGRMVYHNWTEEMRITRSYSSSAQGVSPLRLAGQRPEFCAVIQPFLSPCTFQEPQRGSPASPEPHNARALEREPSVARAPLRQNPREGAQHCQIPTLPEPHTARALEREPRVTRAPEREPSIARGRVPRAAMEGVSFVARG